MNESRNLDPKVVNNEDEIIIKFSKIYQCWYIVISQ